MTPLTILLLGAAGLALVLYVVISEWHAHRKYNAYMRDLKALAERGAVRMKGTQ